MARAHIRRSDESRRNSEAISLEIRPDLIKPKRKMPCDVFQKDEGGTNLLDDSVNFGPQMARIAMSAAATGLTERLARIARSDDIHRAAPRAASERVHIRPQRRCRKAAFFDRRHQSRGGERFPLHPAHDASIRKRQFEAKFEASASGAEREDREVVGT